MTAVVLCSFFLIFLFPLVARADGLPSLKMLSTPSCSACAQMSRVMDELDSQYGGKLTTEKVNLYEHRDVAEQYNVRYVPHLLFLDASGNVVQEKIGYVPLDEVLKIFQQAGISIG
jgi:thioredoxin 1